MKRRLLITGAVAAGAAAAGVAGWRQWSGAAAPTIPVPDLWSLRFERPEGGMLEMAALRGQPLLLNFWATWCPPCIVELPLINRFHHTHTAAGWRVVGLAVDSPTPVREFLKRRPLDFAVGLAGLEGVELARGLGNPSGALPFTVVYRADGSIAARKLGLLAESDLEAYARGL